MRVIFLDRDGVINKYPGDSDYVKSWEEFQFLPKVKISLKRLNDSGFKLVIISNQAGVSKGIYSQETLDLITKNMLNELDKEKIEIAGVYFCIHRIEDNCFCRKPKTGLVDLAINKLKDLGTEIDLKNSYFIGDTIRDVETGKSAGLKTILVFSGKEKPENKNNWQVLPDFTTADLAEAVDIILNENTHRLCLSG
jgi:histidinol-phosphate phosphatase family protein